MTAKQFMDSVNGKGIDYDGAYGNQCVDLIKKYLVEVIGIPAIARGNAKDYWTSTFPAGVFTKITNTPSFIPQRGDIMIWGTKVGQDGHIAIIDTANVNTFVSMDQNWPVGTKCHYQSHNYTGVLGVLRPNKDVNFDQAAYDAAVAAENAKKAAAEAAKKAEADRIAKEKALAEKAEQERIAKEQAKLEEELKKKAAEEAAKKEKEMSAKFRLNKQDLLKVGKGALIALAGALGAYLLTLVGAVDAGAYTPFVAGALSVVANLLVKYASGN